MESRNRRQAGLKKIVSRSFNKVFCLGLSRTGTTSLHEALLALGLRSVHFPIHLFTQPEVLGLSPFQPSLRLGPYAAWRRGKELKASRVHHDARKILERSDAFCDLPVPLFYKELHRQFPGSKFIVTTRALKPWLESMRWLFDEGGILWNRGHIGNELHYRVYGTTSFDACALETAWTHHHSSFREFFQKRESDCLWISVDRGELCFEALDAFLELGTGMRGPCPRTNEAKPVSAQQKLIHYREKKFPYSLLAVLSRKLGSFDRN